MAGLVRTRASQYNPIPQVQGENAEQASSVYQGFYGELPMPATQFDTSTSALKSADVVPSVAPEWTNAPIVRRNDRMKGYIATDGNPTHQETAPPMYQSPYSSKFQMWLIGPIVNYVLNAQLYRAGYPAASVMNGGLHNLALSTRVDQLVTRSAGGPSKSTMTTSQRRFTKVQVIPRYSTMPQSYQTESTNG